MYKRQLQHGWGWGSSFIDWLQYYPGWVWGQEWDWRLTIIPYSLSITGFVYLFLGKWFEKLNKNQKRILAIFIPISIYFIAFIIASIVGFPGDPFDDYKRNPFYWRKTWYVWVLYLIFCGIFEYKLFADKKRKINN